MNPIGHECIRAFAGSGKTYTLVVRYIRLLASGVEPDRVIALTFTRKASGEFLQRIFIMLMQAAGDPLEASKLGQEIGFGNMGTADFQELLNRMIRDVGKLQLGTIDSFFARLVGAFPYELGLSRKYKIMDEYEHDFARQSSMQEMLSPGDMERNTQLLQLYKNLTWGTEDKNVYRIFQEKFSAHQALYQEVDDPDAWGQFNRVFNTKPWWFNTDEMDTVLHETRKCLSGLDFGSRLESAFHKLLDAFESWFPGKALSGGTVLEQLMRQHVELGRGNATITYYQKEYAVEQRFGMNLLRLIQVYLSREITRRMLLTQALAGLLGGFDRHYGQSIRKSGNLVFSDLPVLLINGLCQDNPAFNTSDIIYRLDSSCDHWLIDEFQDTSRIQWKVLSVFLDEILQDPGQQRSFFYVGDIKQSIYTWRGGDPLLFNEILDHYNCNETVIRTRPLSRSWRSAPAVLESVNRIFGKGVSESLFGRDVADRWQSDWIDHTAADKVSKLRGYSAWGLVPDRDSIPGACVDLIQRISPLQRRLSTAVLVRTNKEVLEITQAMRAAGIPASMEGVDYICRDNFVGRWIQAFLQNLIHQENGFFASYLCMMGFDCGETEVSRLSGLVRWDITTSGYPAGVHRLIEYLGARTELSPFLKHRCEQIIEAATRYESLQDNSIERFADFLDKYTVAESSIAEQVQVMTIHKAKGLDFDMVIVAGFGAESITGSSREDLHVSRNRQGEVEWILDMPPKQVNQADATLANADRSHRDKQLYEALCILYVAMTRARRGLYCIAGQPSRNSTTVTWHDLFSTMIGEASAVENEDGVDWQAAFGSKDWYLQSAGEPDTRIEGFRLDRLTSVPHQEPLRYRMSSPSTEAHEDEFELHNLRDTSGMQFGTRVHDFLSRIEWIDSGNRDAIVAGAPDDFRDRVDKLLSSELSREVFGKPAGPASLWREKPYVLKKEDRIANGIIDRAIIILDSAGQPVSMTIFDFKTDSLDAGRPAHDQLMEKYHVQIERYREAAAVLTNLPEKQIRTVLVPV